MEREPSNWSEALESELGPVRHFLNEVKPNDWGDVFYRFENSENGRTVWVSVDLEVPLYEVYEEDRPIEISAWEDRGIFARNIPVYDARDAVNLIAVLLGLDPVHFREMEKP